MSRVYRHYGCEMFSHGLFAAIENEPHFCKPRGGLWGSPLREDGNTGWSEWCRDEKFHVDRLEKFFDFSLREDSRITVVHTLHDLKILVRKYTRPIEDPIFPSTWTTRYLDFVLMSQDFDAIELTESGQWETRLSTPSLYGWDCESVLVLTPAVVVPMTSP